MVRRILIAVAAIALLSGCVSDYAYRGGSGDYYYGRSSVSVYGAPYSSVGYGYPGGGWYGRVHYGYGYPGGLYGSPYLYGPWNSLHGYGYYGRYPPFQSGYYRPYRPPHGNKPGRPYRPPHYGGGHRPDGGHGRPHRPDGGHGRPHRPDGGHGRPHRPRPGADLTPEQALERLRPGSPRNHRQDVPRGPSGMERPEGRRMTAPVGSGGVSPAAMPRTHSPATRSAPPPARVQSAPGPARSAEPARDRSPAGRPGGRTRQIE